MPKVIKHPISALSPTSHILLCFACVSSILIEHKKDDMTTRHQWREEKNTKEEEEAKPHRIQNISMITGCICMCVSVSLLITVGAPIWSLEALRWVRWNAVVVVAGAAGKEGSSFSPGLRNGRPVVNVGARQCGQTRRRFVDACRLPPRPFTLDLAVAEGQLILQTVRLTYKLQEKNTRVVRVKQ